MASPIPIPSPTATLPASLGSFLSGVADIPPIGYPTISTPLPAAPLPALPGTLPSGGALCPLPPVALPAGTYLPGLPNMSGSLNTSAATGLASSAPGPLHGKDGPGATSDTWTPTGSLNDARRGLTLTTLRDGRVLAIGGLPNSGTAVSASTEVYDPRTGWWSRSGALTTTRLDYTATLLSDGRVIVIGGFDINSTHGPLESAEIYDPTTGVWCAGGSMSVPRYLHSAVALKDGRVLVIGGATASGNGDANGILASAELYDPSTRSFTPAHPMHHTRYGSTATLVPDGTVLVTGGGFDISTQSSTEIYDSVDDSWTDGPDMSASRWRHTATLVSVPVPGSQSPPLTEVVVTGGTWLPNTDVYDIASHTWRRGADLPDALQGDTATALADGRVLVSGGLTYGPGPVLASTEIFQPLTGQWSAAAPMSMRRCDHAATLLSDGRLLVAGGFDGTDVTATSELYTP